MKQSIVKVQFLKPVDGHTEYFFGSISAIFERFSVEQIGCNKQNLWSMKITSDMPFVNNRCIISKHPVVRKPQTKK